MNRKKTIVLVSVFLVLVVLGGIVSQRWNVWFGNRPEAPFVSAIEPHRIVLTMGSNELQRMISWQADSVLHTSMVYMTKEHTQDTVRIPAKGHIVRTRGGVTAFHSVLLDSLQAGKNYRYQVVSGKNASQWYAFQTADTTNSFSFIYIGDVQDKDTLKGSKSSFCHIQKLFPKVDFWAFGGDLIERPMDKYWTLVHTDLDSIIQSTPVIAITGNHEYLKNTVRTIDERFAYTFPYFIDKTDDNLVYTFSYKNARFVLLDSNREPWFIWEQRQLLAKILASSTEQFKIVMLHHPVYSNKGKLNQIVLRWMLEPILNKYDVDLVLQGHEHTYARNSHKNNQGKSKTPIYITSHLSKKFYHGKEMSLTDKIILNTPLFQQIEIKKDTLIMSSCTTEGTVIDKIRITKE